MGIEIKYYFPMSKPRLVPRCSSALHRLPSLGNLPLKSGTLALILSILAPEIRALSPYRPEGRIDFQQFILPWEGPGAAVFNPALAAETKHADARYGYLKSASGKLNPDVVQATVMSPWGVAAGFALYSHGTAIDGYNTVYEESVRHFMIAWGRSDVMGTGYEVGVGLARVTHVVNAFGAVRSDPNAYDAGIHVGTPALGPAGALHVGFTVRNLLADEVRLPDDNPNLISGSYDAFLPNYDISLMLKSILGCADVYAEFNIRQDQDPDEGPPMDIPFVKSLGLEYRPIPILGLKVERTWAQRWTAGLVVRAPLAVPVFDGIELGAEANFSHDKILTETDEGRGFIHSLLLNVSI